MAMTQQGILYAIEFRLNKTGAEQATKTLNKLDGSAKKTGSSFSKLAKRAALTIPVWMALRSAMQTVFSTIRDGAGYIVDLDSAMKRSELVISGVEDSAEFVKKLRVEVEALAEESGGGLTEVNEAFQKIATAGIDAELALKGMNIAVKTSKGLMGDTERTARALADIYNTMGKSIKNARTEEEKMNIIAGDISILYRKNNFSLDEFTRSMKTSASTAFSLGLSYKELASLLASSAQLMQRGETAGTQLSRSFVLMTKRIDRVGEILGKTNEELNSQKAYDTFIEVLRTISESSGSAADKTKALLDIIGIKAAKTTLSLAKNLGLVADNLDLIKDNDSESSLKEINKNYDIHLKKLKTLIDRQKLLKAKVGVAFIKGLTGAEDYATALESINESIKGITPSIAALGKVVGIPYKVINDLLALQKKLANYEVSLFTGDNEANRFKEQLIDINKQLDELYTRKEKISKGQSFSRGLGDDISKLYEQTTTGKISGDNGILEKNIDTKIKKLVEAKAGLESLLAREAGYFKGNKETDLGKITIKKPKAPKDDYEGSSEKDTEKEINLTLEDRLYLLDSLSAKGYSELEVAKIKLEILKQNTSQIEDQSLLKEAYLDVLKKEQEQLTENANILKDSFKGGLSSLLKGDSTGSDFFKQISDTITDSMADATAEAMTDSIFKMTGIGDIFGGFITELQNTNRSLEGRIEDAHATVYDQIVRAHQAGLSGKALTEASYTNQSGGIMGGIMSIIGMGGGGKTAIPGRDGYGANTPAGTRDMGTYSKLPQTQSTTGKWGGKAMSLYSAYTQFKDIDQNAKGSGDPWGSAVKGVYGGYKAGSTLGPVGGIVGAVVGGIYGFVRGAMSKTTEEITNQTDTIASKIDISNRQLEIANRNLVALRNSMETFILPDSAYFTEKSSIEDNFSLSSRRGIT